PEKHEIKAKSLGNRKKTFTPCAERFAFKQLLQLIQIGSAVHRVEFKRFYPRTPQRAIRWSARSLKISTPASPDGIANSVHFDWEALKTSYFG
ncbi:hypothetical protein, partial [Mesorhizobium sp. M4B.F.Ca.ET.190.01.1.1]|uniref:hypothetical protein n=1 Tax=Mesorhizobium sp. M4B.F.Ca.ET.190.01.1.1 TaxID=2563951 RepID=UPI001AEE0225